ncbi:MAG: hypothetical protein V4650_01615 [Pseudomonadota bacterium]
MHRIAIQKHPRIRGSWLAATLAALLLMGCSADEGPAGVNTGSSTVLAIGEFAATPDTVAPGGSTTLTYTSTGAASCAASSNAPGSSWMGAQPTSGSFVVTVPQTPGSYTYTLTCSSATGEQTSQTETVTVPAPSAPQPVINDLTATPTSVAPGGSTSLSYTTTGAVSCMANSSAPGSSWAGTQPTSSTGTVVVLPITPGNYTYALTCTNADGQQTTDFETVTVTGGPSDPGEITGDPNDGTTPTTVIDDDGTETPGFFVCTAGARTYGPNPTTEVRVNGLVGSAVTDLLDMLGAGTVTQLQNSVVAKELVVDNNLSTAAQYNLSVGLLGGAISSIDLAVGLNSPAPAAKFAVFLLTFPIGTVEASLIQSVTVTTFLGGVQQDQAVIDASTLDLAGQVSTAETIRFVGLKATLPYDEATISLSPTLVSANVGNAMNVHELCTDGFFINPPTP